MARKARRILHCSADAVMVLPAGKVFSLALRIFTKPMVTFMKTNFKKQATHPQGVERIVIALGRFQHETNVRVACFAMNKQRRELHLLPLSNDKAFDAGAEFAAEAAVYGVLLSWGLYEIMKTQQESRTKEEALKTLVATIEVKTKEEREVQRALEEQLAKLVAEEGS